MNEIAHLLVSLPAMDLSCAHVRRAAPPYSSQIRLKSLSLWQSRCRLQRGHFFFLVMPK